MLIRVPVPRRAGLAGVTQDYTIVSAGFSKSAFARAFTDLHATGGIDDATLVRILAELDVAPHLDDLRLVADDRLLLAKAATPADAEVLAKGMDAGDVITDAHRVGGGAPDVWPRAMREGDRTEPPTHPRAKPEEAERLRALADALDEIEADDQAHIDRAVRAAVETEIERRIEPRPRGTAMRRPLPD